MNHPIRLATALLSLPTLGLCAQTQNVFVMITDGASFGAWDAACLQQNGTTASAAYYGSEYSKFLMTTYPLNTSNSPTGNLTETVGYNPAAAWGLSSYNAGGSSYLHQNYVDSAAAGTALSTGQKTYNNAINWSNLNITQGPTLPEIAKQQGKVVGTVSSVQWSHATPAAFSNAHNVSRNNYAAIANEMLSGNVMDLIMGAGNPQWNDSGVKTITNYNDAGVTDSNARYVGGRNTWIELNEGTHAGNWASVQSRTDIESLAAGNLTALGGRERLVATVEAGSTLQQGRTGYSATDTPGSDPFNATSPSLATMTEAALNVLASVDQGQGMFLQIEGGAIDWAAHANQTSRLVEEQVDFNNSVEVVVDWIEANGGWANNLLIITTDHGNAMPSGPDSNTAAHDRIEAGDIANGQFTLSNPQGVRWWSGNHTNELVPVFARGAGSAAFTGLVDGTDANFSTYYSDWAAAGFTGSYIDATDVFTVAGGAMIPEPQTYAALAGLGALGLVSWRRRSRR